jgi:hypothetical protein
MYFWISFFRCYEMIEMRVKCHYWCQYIII